MSEFDIKKERILSLLDQHQLDAILLRRVSSFAWATCGGASYINTAASDGAGSLLFTRQRHTLITNNIEAQRLESEEHLGRQGWEIHAPSWHSDQDEAAAMTQGLKVGADGFYPGAVDVSTGIASLRSNLLPEEVERFRILSKQCGQAMDAAVRSLQPGMTEHEIAARLASEAHSRGVQPIVNLIAADERVFAYRHPLPTDKRLQRYAMLVLCGRRWGLVCSVTRLVHFGRLPDDLRRKADAVARLDAAFIAATRPGVKLKEIFNAGIAAYARAGYPDEWTLHHQGGVAGYEPREFFATPTATFEVASRQVYAWNPSITGAKSEDSILVNEAGFEVLTRIDGWPMLIINQDGKTIERPAILELD